ncbi:MAG: TIGR03936 family radical SAM-associated protein [Defluviitaleaceae bacterium]|nr:TIGR03936 family radical SAM-associated protein [Defluviitaleaceae bacterium]
MSVNEKVKYRLKFTKSGNVRFIGHLDLMSLFNMAIKRADVPIAYSEGFNPHQIISFALPLSLGYYSKGEYVDISLNTPISCKTMVGSLNKSMPDGLKILAAKKLDISEKSGASLVSACAYRVCFPSTVQVPTETAADFIKQDNIVIEKKTKKNTALTDIASDIFSFNPKITNGLVEEIEICISAGPNRSIRADSVMKALFDFANKPYPEYELRYIREEMYRVGENGFSPLIGGSI